MEISQFTSLLNSSFYTGVPDSLLKPLSSYLMNTYSTDPHHHIIAANEGNAIGIAAGYYLSTKKIPVVYMQNSGEGNMVNPHCSLVHEKVYGIPMILIIGWRGEPNVKDEPQHIFQGEITLKLLDLLEIKYFIISKETKIEDIKNIMENDFKKILNANKVVAFVVKKDALIYDGKCKYTNEFTMKREDIIEHIIKFTKNNPIISTTGKASRELFELRKKNNELHNKDFLTVGSMGHSSSIALSIALQKPKNKIFCIDGDGALIMHMGSLPIIANSGAKNLVHILINNTSHESVGGMPTCADKIDLVTVAKGCGYPYSATCKNYEELDEILGYASDKEKFEGPYFVECKCCIGARSDLGRPDKSPKENKEAFMEYLEGLK